MARRGVTEEIEYPLLEQGIEESARIRREGRDDERPVRRVRLGKKEREESGTKRQRMPKYYWFLPVAALFASFVFVAAFHRVEAFLIADERFYLQAAAEPGVDPPGLTIEGMRRANKAQIERVFEQDLGRSLYLFPVAERRRNLLAVDWIKDATVSRRWPNQVHVIIVERQPAASVQLAPGGGGPEFQLIDSDGVLLPIPQGERLANLAILTGMAARDTEVSRKIRVKEAIAMQRDLGELSTRLSEVDVRDPGNLCLTLRIEDRAVTLKIGNKNYRKRLENFLSHYSGIQQVKPDARVFDLRVDGRITALEATSGD